MYWLYSVLSRLRTSSHPCRVSERLNQSYTGRENMRAFWYTLQSFCVRLDMGTHSVDGSDRQIKTLTLYSDPTRAARGLLGSRHLVVKITDFTDFHLILRGSQRNLRKLGRYFTPKRPQEPPLDSTPNFKINLLRYMVM